MEKEIKKYKQEEQEIPSSFYQFIIYRIDHLEQEQKQDNTVLMQMLQDIQKSLNQSYLQLTKHDEQIQKLNEKTLKIMDLEKKCETTNLKIDYLETERKRIMTLLYGTIGAVASTIIANIIHIL